MMYTKLLAYLLTRCADFGRTTPVRIWNQTTGEIIDEAYCDILDSAKKGDPSLGNWVIDEGHWNGNAPCAFSIKTVNM